VKKLPLTSLANLRKSGIIASRIPKHDSLVDVKMVGHDEDIILASHRGLGVRFRQSDLRAMGRNAYGVKGIRLASGDRVVGMVVVREADTLFLATELGYGKRVDFKSIRSIRRGGKGVKLLGIGEKNGNLITAMAVSQNDELILISSAGHVIRLRTDRISVLGRPARGFRLMRLNPGDRLMDVARIPKEDQP
jgi:DNA gyrase subunit A